MSGILFFIFASCEPLTCFESILSPRDLHPCWTSQAKFMPTKIKRKCIFRVETNISIFFDQNLPSQITWIRHKPITNIDHTGQLYSLKWSFPILGLTVIHPYAGFRLACRSPHCRFDGDFCTTAQTPLAAEGWPNGEQRLANKSITLSLCPPRQIAYSWLQFNLSSQIQLESDAARW